MALIRRRGRVPGDGDLARHSDGRPRDADPAIPVIAEPDGLVTGVIVTEVGASFKRSSRNRALADGIVSSVTDVVEHGLANGDCTLFLAMTAILLVHRVIGSCVAGSDGGLGQSQGGNNKSSLHIDDGRSCQESDRKQLECVKIGG